MSQEPLMFIFYGPIKSQYTQSLCQSVQHLKKKKSRFDSSLGKFSYLLVPPPWSCLHAATVSSASKPESFPNLQGQIKAARSSTNLQPENSHKSPAPSSALPSHRLISMQVDGGRPPPPRSPTCTRLIRTLLCCRLSNLLSCK